MDKYLTGISGYSPITSQQPSVHHHIAMMMQKFIEEWWQTPATLPDLGRAFSANEQSEREAELNDLINQLIAEVKLRPETESQRAAAQERLSALGTRLASNCLGLETNQLDIIQKTGLIEAAVEFAQLARHFDPNLTSADIYQASRNAWTMNFFQLMFGLPVQVTPAVFAFSLLYPYSDNYLDDPGIPLETKLDFNERFRQRIAGEDFRPANGQEKIISDLIGIIEAQYSREAFPQVYESLLALHAAQSRSIRLLRRNRSPFEVDVLGICFEKGGTSGLADGYLVAGDMDEAQCEMIFLYGIYTQLVDDLEDVQSDTADGLMTMFSYTAQHWTLDALTNRTLHFSSGLLKRIGELPSPACPPFKELLEKSLSPALIASAGSAPQLYTRAYLAELQSHVPFRFAFLKRQREKLSKNQVNLVKLVEKFS